MTDVTTTAGETFSYEDHADMALMVYRRFGYDVDAAAAAWRRMLQNNASTGDFMDLLIDAAARLPANKQIAHILKRAA